MHSFPRKHSVLIVDDEADILSCFEKFLNKNNINCVIAESAVSAIEILKKSNFEAVVTDIDMPQMDGLEFFSKVKKIDNRLPIILITGTIGYDTAIEAAKLSAFDYITKPFDLYQLKESVNNAIKHYNNSDTFT